jgi:hypothetical protein
MHDLMKLDLGKQKKTEMKPIGLTELTRPTGLAFDPKRDRLIVANTRQDKLYSYSLTLNQWSVIGRIGEIGEIGSDLEALTYSTEDDTLYGITSSYSEDFLKTINLVSYNANGAIVKIQPLPLQMGIGTDENGYGEARTQLVSVGRYLVVLIYASYYEAQNSRADRIYLVNPRTGRVVAAR